MNIYLKRWLRSLKEILVDLISSIGIFWLFVEIADYSTNGGTDKYLKSVEFFGIVFLLLLIISALRNKPKTHFNYQLRGKDNRIEVRVGDIFANSGALVVPVNNKFDMSLGGNVSKANSIQNQVIQKYYSGKADHLTTDIEKVIRVGKKYDIGTTVEVEQPSKKIYLTVNSVKGKNNRVKSDLNDMAVALDGLWTHIALESGRNSVVSIPLINTQHGRNASLSRRSAIIEIITSYIEASKDLDICDKLIVSIHPTDLKKGEIDLDEINDFLKYSCRHYRKITLQKDDDESDSASRIIQIEN